MYARGLRLQVLAEFVDHDGFDGVILGCAEDRFHLEFTSRRGHEVGRAPTEDHLLVFYISDRTEWEASCARMMGAGFRGVVSCNPYWDVRGRTFEDRRRRLTQIARDPAYVSGQFRFAFD